MKTINGYFAPDANEIRNAVKNARKGTLKNNYVQLWFDTVDGKFHKEEFVDCNSYVNLPEYCFKITPGWEEETTKTIENYLKEEQI